MKIYDLETGEEVPFTFTAVKVKPDTVDADHGPLSLDWTDQALLIDLGQERDLHGLVFDTEGSRIRLGDDYLYAPFALFVVGEKPPSVFWRDYVHAHPDADAAPVKDFDTTVQAHVPSVPYRAYSKTCPPPPAPAPSPSFPGSVGNGGSSVCRWVATYAYDAASSSDGDASNRNRNTHTRMVRTFYSDNIPKRLVDELGRGWVLVSSEYRCG